MSAKLISIIGPPASGKTTLAEALAGDLPAGLIREDFAGNPFLADSYTGSSDARLPGQLYFLMSRVQQLSRLSWPAQGLHVSDYGFCQDRIFARVRLEAAEFELYRPLSRQLENLVHPPDVLVVLTAGTEVLLRRIESRGRTFERVMTPQFLLAMQQAYEQAAAAVKCPVLRVDTSAHDLRTPDGRRDLVATIRAAVKN